MLCALALLATACPSDSGGAPTSGPTSSSADDRIPTTTANSDTQELPTLQGDVVAGADSIGDPIFPSLGNGGYDVLHYEILLDATGPELQAVATLDVLATQNLSSLNVDLVGMSVDEIQIDGVDAAFSRDGRELTVEPTSTIVADSLSQIQITYHGTPTPVPDPAFPTDLGWLDEPWGSYVAAEPLGAATWFPGNDHPLDKATFEISVTVDEGLIGAGPGLLVSEIANEGSTTFVWVMDDPMATYLASVVIGDFVILTTEIQTTGRETPIVLRDVFPTSRADEVSAVIEGRHEAMIEAFEPIFGPYPFDTYGLVGVPEQLGYALENQTLSLFGIETLANDSVFVEQVQAHELAHQWFGNHVSPASWDDIWLNEGFASWADLYWTGIVVGQDQFQRTAGVLDNAALGPLVGLDPDELFGQNVYLRGALALEALRRTEGDDSFFELLRAWTAKFGGRSASTDDFVELVGEWMNPNAVALIESWINDEQMPSLPGT